MRHRPFSVRTHNSNLVWVDQRRVTRCPCPDNRQKCMQNIPPYKRTLVKTRLSTKTDAYHSNISLHPNEDNTFTKYTRTKRCIIIIFSSCVASSSSTDRTSTLLLELRSKNICTDALLRSAHDTKQDQKHICVILKENKTTGISHTQTNTF